jgi:DNA-binding NarL/FixJ family response regulator
MRLSIFDTRVILLFILKDASEENLIAAIKGVYSGLNVAQNDVFQKVKYTWAVEQLDAEKNKYRDFVNSLTAREKDIVKLLVNSHTYTEIADVLGITEGTVKNIISGIIATKSASPFWLFLHLDSMQFFHYSRFFNFTFIAP